MKKELFREQLRDYVKTSLGLNPDNLNDVQWSKCMARFYAEKVIRCVNPDLVPTTEEEIEACVTDGKDDCGVDFLSREGNTVLILQAKFSGHKKASKKRLEEPDKFDSFCSVLERLYLGPKKFKMNQKLKEARVDIDWDRDSFLLHYITLAQPAQNSYQQAKSGIHPVSDVPDLPDRVSLELRDEQALNESLRDALSVRQEASTRATILFAENEGQSPWLRFDDAKGRVSYVGRITGSQVAEIFRANKSTIFSLNIRNYIGDNQTNRGIKATATNAPEDFFLYNNGISALAARIVEDEDQKTLLCDDFSIINGAQTVRSLRNAHKDAAESVRHAKVLIRITEARPKEVGPDFLYSITKFNNTQNTIKISDFRSNDKVQIDLADKFERLPARGGRKFKYRNKRTGDGEKTRIQVEMEKFTKTVHSFLHGPDDVYGGSQYLFDTSKEGGYFKIYGDGRDLLPALSEAQFNRLVGIWFACEYVKQIWEREVHTPSSEALERRWMVFFGVGEVMRQVHGHSEELLNPSLEMLASPGWYLEQETHRYKATLRRHCKLAFAALKNSYGEANARGSTHRNWFRDRLTLASIRKQVGNLWSVVSEDADNYLFTKPKREAS